MATEIDFTTADGLTLRADRRGDPEAPPVVLLHGGGQTRHAWGGTAQALADAGWQTIAVDLRGHGDSDRSPTGDYSVDAFVSDVRGIVSALDVPPVLVGASLGGMMSLLAVGEPPPADAAALVLVDVAHRLEPDGAARIIDFMHSAPDGFASPDEAAAAVASYLPHREAPRDTSGLERNLRQRDGRWHWHWDPRLFSAPGSLGDPTARARTLARARDAAAALTIPTLLVRGAISDVVSPEIVAEFAELAPHATIVDVRGAAHMVAGDQNDRFTDAVTGFLAAAR
jgi:pimeloyl-ACP methyl ester carboxylesterase